jgi:hypothetical protein
MAFDQTTRNQLQRFVSDVRTLLTGEFTRQLQHQYGLDPTTGEVTDLAKITAHLTEEQRETARRLRETLDHYLAGSPSRGKQQALDRIVREQAFTVLNRLCALRMAEARGLLIESIARGYNSKGFQLYARLAGSALGETGDACRGYLFIDPACGSMHFGLYAFDLFETIYAEAWELEQRAEGGELRGAGAEQKAATDSAYGPLHTAYSSKSALQRDVPRLIIERNIHGIDIDPRAVQIAGLSLWLRAQRSWQLQGIKPQDRPQIRRSNVVCAEPMPGEESLLQEFLDKHLSADPERQLLGQLVRRVFEAMKLAGEAGSLLKVEEEIATSVAEAKKAWLARPQKKQRFFVRSRSYGGPARIGAGSVRDHRRGILGGGGRQNLRLAVSVCRARRERRGLPATAICRRRGAGLHFHRHLSATLRRGANEPAL